MKKEEIESRLVGMSDFLKMEFLENCLRREEGIEIRKFCYKKLAELYNSKSMFNEAAKNMDALASFSVTYKDKIRAYMKAVEFFIKGNYYDRVEDAFRKALACGNSDEKKELKMVLKELYFKQAKDHEMANKNAAASKAYEKIFSMELSEKEKQEVRNKLLKLYEKLGKIREYNALRNQ